MARYIGPKGRIERKYNEPILGSGKVLSKKGYPPGQHGKSRRRNPSEYSVQLKEKQKIKYIYGIGERYLRNIVKKAASKKGTTGDIFLQTLERRLDNAAYRLGIYITRSAARQGVTHGHLYVNGKRVDIPSYLLKEGDTISLKEKTKTFTIITSIQERRKQFVKKHPWFTWNEQEMAGTFVKIPDRESIPESIKEQSIIEYYSK